MSEDTQQEQKLDVKLTFFIGLAFFTTGIAWSLYNTQVSQQLEVYLLGFLSLVGILMALDNIIGVVIQPIMGSISDQTRSKYGRRTPYIIIGVISSAIFFALIPTGFGTDLWILLLWMLLFSISMGFYRSQAVALMPDFVRPVNRSKANAIINFMGGVGSIVAFSLGYLVDVFPNQFVGLQVVFAIASVIMIIALIIFLWKVDEKEAYSYKLLLEMEKTEVKQFFKKKEGPGLTQSIKDIVKEDDKSTLFVLFAIFCWFVAYQGLEALFATYASDPNILNTNTGFASFIFNFVAIPFILFAIPAGILGTKIGRRLTIKIGLIVMISALLIGFFLPTLTITLIALVFAGIGWAMINVNSIVIVWELAPSAEKIGTYTGVYYFFSVLAAILGPGIIGGMSDLFGKSSMLLDAAIFLLLALVLMFFVKRGELNLTEEEKLKRQKIIGEEL
jgi:MFS family permease